MTTVCFLILSGIKYQIRKRAEHTREYSHMFPVETCDYDLPVACLWLADGLPVACRRLAESLSTQKEFFKLFIPVPRKFDVVIPDIF